MVKGGEHVYRGLVRAITIASSNSKNPGSITFEADGMVPISLAVITNEDGEKRLVVLPKEDIPERELVCCQPNSKKSYLYSNPLTITNLQYICDAISDMMNCK